MKGQRTEDGGTAMAWRERTVRVGEAEVEARWVEITPWVEVKNE